MRKIVAVSIAAIVVIVAVLALTKVGHVIDAATQHFMLYYAGVLALIGLTGSVLISLIAVDRIVMTPGHRVMAQAVHRAFAFGTLAFLIIHIVTEILAQRSHVLDAAVPFLSPYRTFYIGLGTIASDLIVLLVITGIIRNRFTAHGKAWRWRAIHYTSYVAFVFGVLHGLLGGRTAKPYVDWSYGFAIAVTALGLALRFLAVSLRPKESLGSSPSADRAGTSSSSPMRAAAMAMAQAQLGRTTQILPPGLGTGDMSAAGLGASGASGATSWTATALPAPGRSPASGPLPALPAPVRGPEPAYAGPLPVTDAYGQLPGPYDPDPYGPVPGAYRPAPDAYGPVPDAYGNLGFTPLGAPPYGDDAPRGMRARPYAPVEQPRPALAGQARQPRYEPGYDGPPRFVGAPRGHGDVPQDTLSSYPYGPPAHLAPPVSPYPEDYPDRGPSGGWPDGRTAPRPGPMESAPPRAAITAGPRPGDRNSGPQPQVGSGPMARPGTGPMPRANTGPMPRANTGPMPRISDTGSMPRAGGGQPRHGTGPMPRPDTGSMPRISDTGSMPRVGSGPMPRLDTGPMPRVDSGPMPRLDSGPMPRPDTGAMPRISDTGSMPRAGGGQPPRHGAGAASPPARGRAPRADTGALPRLGTGPMPRADSGPMPRPDAGLNGTRGTRARHSRPEPDPATGPRTGSSPRPANRPSHRARTPDPRYRDMPGPTGGGEWE